MSGGFGSIGGQPRIGIARLDATTGLADSFNPNSNSVIHAIAVQPDGKILVGGDFDAAHGTPSIGGQTRNHIARLDPTTGLADTFDPNANNIVYSIAVQADGKVLAGGNFANIGGQPRNRIARLDATTGLADTFDPNAPNGIINSIVVQSDGKILVGGNFFMIGGQLRGNIARLATGSSAACAPAGIIGWWPFEGDGIDVSGNNNNAALSGVYSFVGGVVNQGWQVTNGAARVADAAVLRPSTAVTVEGWVKANSSPGIFSYLFGKSYDGCSSSYALYTGGSGGLQFYVRTSADCFGYVGSPDAGIGIWDGQFHHVAGTYDGSAVRLFVDGVEQGTGTPATGPILYQATVENGDLFIGRFDSSSQFFVFSGTLDEIALYSRALSPAEIQGIANAGSGGKCLRASAITSANNTTFTVGSNGSFTVTATGVPTPTLSESGALPSGVTFTPATGVLSGTPATGTQGTYPITFTASNGVGSNAVQNFTLTANPTPQAPAITSANNTTFAVGSNGSFSVTATGIPTPTLSESGALPSGVTFTPATGVLSGTPAVGTGGVYPITFTANNGAGSPAMQSFTLTVNEGPAITSANDTSFSVGSNGSFTVTATGNPTPTLSESGALPSGVTFTPATGVLGGTPAAGTAGTYPITITANNGVGSPAMQSFTLTVIQPPQAPAITSANNTAFAVGNNGSFTVTATGFPTPTLSQSGGLPSGVTFVPATGVLGGTPAAGTTGTYPITFTASNGVGSPAMQSFTLTVTRTPGADALDGFDPNADGPIRVVVVQPNGKILLGGDFTTLSPNGGVAVTRNHIARLNPDGTLDTAFDPNANGIVRSIALQTDGKIMVGGDFRSNSIGGQTRNRIARLDATTGAG